MKLICSDIAFLEKNEVLLEMKKQQPKFKSWQTFWRDFPKGSAVKNLSALQETWVQAPGWEDPLDKGIATHSSILARKIPWTGSLVGYGSWDCRVEHD